MSPHPDHAHDPPVPVEEEVYDLEAAAELSGLHPGIILELVRSRVLTRIHDRSTDSPRFDARAIYRLRQIGVLREERTLSMHSVRFVIDLIERLEAAELELRALREKSL
jgi:MerR HTH family regulatory protein